MKKNGLLLLCLVLLISLFGCKSTKEYAGINEGSGSDNSSLDYTVLRVGMECAYAPNNWQEDTASDTNLPIDNLAGFYAEGYDVQMAKLLGEKLGVEIQIVKLSWSGLIEALNAGQIDLILAGMADTEERKQSINFTQRYSTPSEYVILTTANGAYADITNIQELSGAYVLGQKDTQYDTVIDQIAGVNHVAAVEGVPNMITRLQQGTVDAIVLDEDTCVPYLEMDSNFRMITFTAETGFDKGFTGACIGLRKDDSKLLEAINAVLDTISDDQREEMLKVAQEKQPK